MSTKVRVKDGIVSSKVLQDRGEYVETNNAEATCTAKWFVHPFASAYSQAPTIGSSCHPTWTSLCCTTFGIKKHGKGAIITAEYEGSSYTLSNNSEVSEDKVLEISSTMMEVSIESHPDFETWAGTPKNPTGYAKFDDDGQFLCWDADKFKDNNVADNLNMVGVTSFMVPTFSATVSYKSKSMPDLKLGVIGEENGLPALSGYKEWMRIGVSYSSVADGTWSVVINYMSSGDRGWNRFIYPQD